MNDRLRTRIAAGGTIAALGVLATVALAAGSSGSNDQAASQPTIPPPQVRTVVERRTVHVRRKTKAVRAPAVASATPAPAAAPAPVTAAPVPDPAPVVRVSERHGEVEHGVEHEAGDDHGGRDHGGDDNHGDD